MMKKDEWLKANGFYRRIEDRREDGTYLTSAQEELLAEASWQSHRKVNESKKPKAMTPGQRGVKRDLLSSWRKGLESLRLVDVAFPHGKDATAWFREKDLRKALDKDAIVEVVRMSAFYFGVEYADAILDAVRSTYENAGEQIVIQRVLSSWGTFRPGIRP
ncbi:MAG: hypothetical protein A3K66_03595 [Euryarchaeota archaeon RBG_16_67_27]|nr:MAG: hypothetical protein A3K66_03595 [Euryarchaeota archaeon RBG_16_67_27]